MNKIIKQRKKSKLVDDGFEDIIIFKTINGTEFENEKQAQEYEDKIIKARNFNERYKLKKIEIDGFYDAIFIKELTEEVKHEVYNHYPHNNYCSSIRMNDLVEGWNLIRIDDSGDYTYATCYNPKDMIKVMKAQIKDLENLLLS